MAQPMMCPSLKLTLSERHTGPARMLLSADPLRFFCSNKARSASGTTKHYCLPRGAGVLH